MASRAAWAWVAVGGLAAGAGDIAFACIYWWLTNGVPPARILQSVASGLLGKAAYQGGAATALLGLALHFAMTLAMAGAYFGAALRLPALWRRAVTGGALYGVLLYGVMNYVVVPLSRAGGRAPGNDLWTWLGVAAHVLLVGIPIALAVRRACGPREHRAR